MNKEGWEKRRRAWAYAMQDAATEIGEAQVLYRILGSVAWGRFDGEPTANDPKDNVIFGAGFLQGFRLAALNAGRELKLPGTIRLERIHERVRERGG